MKWNRLIVLVALLSLSACVTTEGTESGLHQPSVSAGPTLNIWPGEAPGSEGWTRTEVEHPAKPGETNRIVRNVTTPTMTAYLPDAEHATGAAVVIAPGGGWLMLSIDTEGHQAARWLASRGIAAFVLRYRLAETAATEAEWIEAQRNPDMQALLQRIWRAAAEIGPLSIADGEQALRVVRAHAAEWNIDPNRVGILGFSAGGYVATGALVTTDLEARPSFVAPIYGGSVAAEADLSAQSPPVFMAVSSNDPLSFSPMVQMAAVLRDKHVPHELHTYARGGHGYGMVEQGMSSDHWIDQFYWWLDDIGMLEPSR